MLISTNNIFLTSFSILNLVSKVNLAPLWSISCFCDFCVTDQLILNVYWNILNRKYFCWPLLVNLPMWKCVSISCDSLMVWRHNETINHKKRKPIGIKPLIYCKCAINVYACSINLIRMISIPMIINVYL